MIEQALQKYTAASNGQLPADVSQLKPYFDVPVDDALIQRYQMVRTGSLSGVPRDAWLVEERAQADQPTVARIRIGIDGHDVK